MRISHVGGSLSRLADVVSEVYKMLNAHTRSFNITVSVAGRIEIAIPLVSVVSPQTIISSVMKELEKICTKYKFRVSAFSVTREKFTAVLLPAQGTQ